MVDEVLLSPRAGAGSQLSVALPAPALSIRAPHLTIRPGVPNDLAWIDQMQRIHAGKLGFLWAKSIKQRLEGGMVRVAIDAQGCQHAFILWSEKYSGRDDLAICFQLAVAPAHFRRLIGASLVAEWLSALPFGCRLAGCWCAQDLPANNFWEACGFTALAWRTGSRGKQRPHIWWCRRVRQADTFPLWFPAKTTGGAIGEERLVIPIMPGQHWSDPVPTLMPQALGEKMLASGLEKITPEREARLKEVAKSKSERLQIAVAGSNVRQDVARPVITLQGIRFIGGAGAPPPGGRPKPPKVKRVTDPELRRKCRDLRDRFLEALHTGQLALPSLGKYEVGVMRDTTRLLDGMAAVPIRVGLPEPAGVSPPSVGD
jgi:hypothetical protein